MASEPIRTTYRARTPDDKTAGPPELATPVVAFLNALARAARQFRTYPEASPLCVDAAAACDRAFAACEAGSPLLVRVTPHELIVDDVQVGRGTALEQELARPLHRARVASVEFDRSASPRDWSRFCGDLFRVQRLLESKTTLAELLAEGGVAAIRARATPRPELVELGVPPAPLRALVDRERTRRAAAVAGAPSQYFYPPEKGWVRLDPTIPLDSVSLIDLAVLVDDPAALAQVLMRLTDDDAEPPCEAASAIEQKYGDLVMLMSALDPRLARVLLAKLARAVLALDGDRRRQLLRRTILPGLLDGRADAGAVLGDFPDVDLADALCLLLDLETAAPEVLSTALDRLALAGERRRVVVPLIREKLASGGADLARPDSRALESYAGGLIRVAPEQGKAFDEFAAFDLSIGAGTLEELARVREAAAAIDPAGPRLGCLLRLVRLEPNPAAAAGFVDQAVALLRDLARGGRWIEIRRAVEEIAASAAALREPRPDASGAIHDALARFADRTLVVQLAGLCDDPPSRGEASSIVAALGPAVVPPWVAALDRPGDQPRVRPMSALIAEHATALAPALAAALATSGAAAARAIVAALGFARGHHEALIGAQLERGDEAIGREVIRALARIGSREAAKIVAGRLEGGPAWARAVAEDALWRFPHAMAVGAARDLLSRRSFVLREPKLAERLLDRAAHAAVADLDPVLAQLVPLRFRFWNPALVRIAEKARELQQ